MHHGLLLHVVITGKLVVKLTICWLNPSYHFIVWTHRIVFGSHRLSSFVFRLDVSGARLDLRLGFFLQMGEWRLLNLDWLLIDAEVIRIGNVSCRLPGILERPRLINFNVLFPDLIVLYCGSRNPKVLGTHDD